MPGSADKPEDISKRSTLDYEVADASDIRPLIILTVMIVVAIALAFFLWR
jgi:hypothetical protein